MREETETAGGMLLSNLGIVKGGMEDGGGIAGGGASTFSCRW